MKTLLEIENLHVEVEGKPILQGIDLSVAPGEVHAIMGPNGSGKSTLASVLAGREGFVVTRGSIRYRDQDLLALSPETRACEGIYLAFQYPVALPGVGNLYFLRAALNAKRRHLGQDEIDAMDFLQLAREKMKVVRLPEALGRRAVNDGFSGGEKKKNEIFHMAVLEPTLCVLDETDSGLDIDALKDVCDGVNALRSPERGMLLITHYQRLLQHIRPDRVHVLLGGRIVDSGGPPLAEQLEAEGYARYGRTLEGAA